jgi:hypothetical protein
MNFADDAEFAAFIGRDHMLPAVTADAVACALAGFAVPLTPGRDMDWLAMAVRRSLAISVPNIGDGPERTSNADIRGELERLAALAGSTWLELFQCHDAADSRLWDHSWHHWDGEGGKDMGDGIVMGEPSDYRRFKAAVAELDWLAGFLRRAATATEVPRKQWKNPERKALRIQRGQYLAPVFEAAFGQPVSANNWPSGNERKPTAFMDFYKRMIALAFGEHATPNLSGVLKAACRLHRQHPAEFAEGIIPGL